MLIGLKQKLDHGAVFLKTDECFELPEQTFMTIDLKTTKRNIESFKGIQSSPIDQRTWLNSKMTVTPFMGLMLHPRD